MTYDPMEFARARGDALGQFTRGINQSVSGIADAVTEYSKYRSMAKSNDDHNNAVYSGGNSFLLKSGVSGVELPRPKKGEKAEEYEGRVEMFIAPLIRNNKVLDGDAATGLQSRFGAAGAGNIAKNDFAARKVIDTYDPMLATEQQITSMAPQGQSTPEQMQEFNRRSNEMRTEAAQSPAQLLIDSLKNGSGDPMAVNESMIKLRIEELKDRQLAKKQRIAEINAAKKSDISAASSGVKRTIGGKPVSEPFKDYTDTQGNLRNTVEDVVYGEKIMPPRSSGAGSTARDLNALISQQNKYMDDIARIDDVLAKNEYMTDDSRQELLSNKAKYQEQLYQINQMLVTAQGRSGYSPQPAPTTNSLGLNLNNLR